ncbi:hypothetical protein L3Y34_017092 [Caenorhabditis briggsae]|uniref:Uncharacterized protein n=1 Tax=Caenorhabditis briggsae TaxID=6238 RepID=A0AAE9DGJ4_CAEBR|nr:hypothetical protein L3Y34_017092 [Caenorhabditis briggsae]
MPSTNLKKEATDPSKSIKLNMNVQFDDKEMSLMFTNTATAGVTEKSNSTTGSVEVKEKIENKSALRFEKDLRDVATLDNDQQNSSIWKADLSSGSNGDRNVSMEFKNAPSAALSTFSQILKIGTSTMDSTDFPGDGDGLRLEISVNLIVFCNLSFLFFVARDFLRFPLFSGFEVFRKFWDLVID